jgi:DNA-binding protein HU-beta
MTGFAKFVKVERAARMGRNPATGEQIRIKASKRARIAPAKTFKDAVLSPSRAPKLARGVWPLDAEAVKRAGQSDAAISPMKKAPAKKAPAKKAPAKRAPAKRAPAKKAPAKKAVAPQKTGGMRTVARKR